MGDADCRTVKTGSSANMPAMPTALYECKNVPPPRPGVQHLRRHSAPPQVAQDAASRAAQDAASRAHSQVFRRWAQWQQIFEGSILKQNISLYETAQERARERALRHAGRQGFMSRIFPFAFGASANRPELRITKVIPAESLPMDAESGEWESYKFDGEESGIHMERRSNLPRWHHVKLAMVSLLIVAAIGALCAMLAASMAIGAHFFHSYVVQMVARHLAEGSTLIGFGIYQAASLLLILFAALLVRWAPAAAGSGLPLLKANLNGCQLHRNWAGPSTLLAKSAGITFVVASGLPLGKEGPFVHIGAMVGFLLSGLRIGCTSSLLEMRMPRFQREWVGLGAAAGVVAAFNAPLGGILYAFEEVCSSWSSSLTWRCVLCAVVVSGVASLLATVSEGWLHYDSFVVGLDRTEATLHPPVTRREILPLLLLAVSCGALGGAFNIIIVFFCRLRSKAFKSRPNMRIVEALLLCAVAFSLYYWLPFALTCTLCPDSSSAAASSHAETDVSHILRRLPEAHSADLFDSFGLFDSLVERRGLAAEGCMADEKLPLARWHCDEGLYSELGTLLQSGQEGLIKHLLSRAEVSPFAPVSLALVALVYLAFALILMGLAVPAGNFVPGIVIGAAVGRLSAVLLAQAGGIGEGLSGSFALAGAAAMLGGMTHMTITVAVILVEVTDDSEMMPTLMLMLAVSKSVSLLFSHSFDDCMMHALGLPFLEEDPPVQLDMLCARDVMEKAVKTLQEVETVGKVSDLLSSSTHNGFPVVTPEGHVAGLILRRQILVLLRHRVWEGPHRMTDDFKEKFVGSYALSSLRGGAWIAELRRDATIDLRCFMDPCPLCPGYLTPLNRVHRLFNEFGMRHLPVINRDAKLCGIITRKDLLPDEIQRRVSANTKAATPSLRDLLTESLTRVPHEPFPSMSPRQIPPHERSTSWCSPSPRSFTPPPNRASPEGSSPRNLRGGARLVRNCECSPTVLNGAARLIGFKGVPRPPPNSLHKLFVQAADSDGSDSENGMPKDVADGRRKRHRSAPPTRKKSGAYEQLHSCSAPLMRKKALAEFNAIHLSK